MALQMIIVRIVFFILCFAFNNKKRITNTFFPLIGHFDLNAPDAELQKLVIAIDGPSKADIQIEVIDVGLYRVHYKCQLPGISKSIVE